MNSLYIRYRVLRNTIYTGLNEQYEGIDKHATSFKDIVNIWRLRLKMVERWCMCCMIMFRWTIEQPGIQKFWNLFGLYQDIYDWISPLNKGSGWPFILYMKSLIPTGAKSIFNQNRVTNITTLFSLPPIPLECISNPNITSKKKIS